MLGPAVGILQHRSCAGGISSSADSRVKKCKDDFWGAPLQCDTPLGGTPAHQTEEELRAHHTLPVFAAIPSVFREQQYLISQTSDSGCSHLPDETLKMDIKVSQTCLMPPLLTPHNYSVLADAQPKSQGTEDKLAGRRQSRPAPCLSFGTSSVLCPSLTAPLLMQSISWG